MTDGPPNGVMLYCPIAPAIHPDAEKLGRRSRAWITGFDFFADPAQRDLIRKANWGEAACLCYPVGAEPIAQTVVDWITFVCLFDEFVDEPSSSGDLLRMGDLFGKLVRTLEVPDAGLLDKHSPVTAPWEDLARRFQALAGPRQLRHIVEGHRQWFQGIIWEQTHVRSRTRPDLNEYATLRMLSVGGPTTSAMIAVTRDYDVDADEAETPRFRAVNEVALLLYGWGNDLISYGKDLPRIEAGSGTLNVVDLVRRADATDVATAIERTAVMLDTLMLLYVRLREALWPAADPPLREHLTGLDHLVRGVLDWHLVPNTTRFSEAGPHGGFSVRLADTPATPLAQLERPLHLPSIRWWWDQLPADTRSAGDADVSLPHGRREM
jgi:hypothetical protein